MLFSNGSLQNVIISKQMSSAPAPRAGWMRSTTIVDCPPPNSMIEGIGVPPEFHPFEQRLHVPRHRVGGHDQGGVKCVDVLARARTHGESDQRSDGDLGEAEVVGDAGEAVPQDVGCHIPERRVGEELLPALRKVSNGVVLTLAGEDIGSIALQACGLKVIDDRKADLSLRCAFFAVLQSKATASNVALTPTQADDLAAPTTGQGNKAEDFGVNTVLAVMLHVLEKATQRPILCFAQPTVPNLVSRFLETMRRVLINNPRLNRLGENASEKTHGPDGSAAAATHDRLTAQFLRLHHNARFLGDDVLHQIVDVRLGDVLDPSRTKQRNHAPTAAADIGPNRGCFLGATAFYGIRPACMSAMYCSHSSRTVTARRSSSRSRLQDILLARFGPAVPAPTGAPSRASKRDGARWCGAGSDLSLCIERGSFAVRKGRYEGRSTAVHRPR